MKVDKFRLKVEALGLDKVIENKRGIMVLPMNCTPYILFIKKPMCYTVKGHIRDILLKPILSIAETLARW